MSKEKEKEKEVRIYGLEGVEFITVKPIKDIQKFVDRDKEIEQEKDTD